MKPILCSLLGVGYLLIAHFADAQSFEAGYVVTANKDTLKGFIQADPNGETPKSIVFKKQLSEGEGTTFFPGQLQSFYLSELGEIYVTKAVDIDVKSASLQNLDRNGAARFVRSTVFLKMLVEGKATLYFYASGGKSHFFLQKDMGVIRELVRILYEASVGSVIEVDAYRGQLTETLSECRQNYNHLAYEKADLLKAVVRYNECQGSKSSFVENQKIATVFYVMAGASAAGWGSFSGEDDHPGQVNTSGVKFHAGVRPMVAVGFEFKQAKSTQHFSVGAELFWRTDNYSGTVNDGHAQKTAVLQFSGGGLSLLGRYSFGKKNRMYVRAGLSAMGTTFNKNQLGYTSDIAFQTWKGTVSSFQSFSPGYLGALGTRRDRFMIELRLTAYYFVGLNQSSFSASALSAVVAYRLKK